MIKALWLDVQLTLCEMRGPGQALEPLGRRAFRPTFFP